MSPTLPACFWRWELLCLKNSCCHERVNSWEGPSWKGTRELAVTISFFFFCASKNQSQHKSKGAKLTPDDPSELALMYQRMFEGFTLAQKSGKLTKQDTFHEPTRATCWVPVGMLKRSTPGNILHHHGMPALHSGDPSMHQFTQWSHGNMGQVYVGDLPLRTMCFHEAWNSQDSKRDGKNTNLVGWNILNRLISVITVMCLDGTLQGLLSNHPECFHCCYITSYKGSERIWGRFCPAFAAFVVSSWNRLFLPSSGIVIYYHYLVPEEERHDSAIKRNREALSSEVKLWEGYLEKVKLISQENSTFAQTINQ